MDNLTLCFALQQIPNFTYQHFQRLVSYFDDPRQIFSLTRPQAFECGLSGKQIYALQHIDWGHVNAHTRWVNSQTDIETLTVACQQYPARLREITPPPLVLYIRGDRECLQMPQIAIVGSRAATRAGVDISTRFAEALTSQGIIVTSGCARGIDTAAHLGALKEGKTIAVMGCGVNQIYPKQNAALLSRIADSGAIVSEFLPQEPPRACYFPKRNRIISGLSLGVLVVEAAVKSGSLITAYSALEQNREVFAIPGPIDRPSSRGCHRLLKEGATLVETIDDIIDNIPHCSYKIDKQSRHFTAEEKQIIEYVREETMPVDAIVQRSGLCVTEVIPILSSLEIAGLVIRVPGGYKSHKDKL